MSIFQKKSFSDLIAESKEEGEHSLKKTLGYWNLIALGLGAVIGAGLFSITGLAAGNYAGPSVAISFLIAAAGCCFAGLCYAELASMLPIAGSAYTYSYAILGEFVAWTIGWDLVLEYAFGALTVSLSWTRYLVKFFEQFSIYLPAQWTAGPWEGGILNLPAAFIVIVLSLLLILGTEGSSRINAVIVYLKIIVVLAFIILGCRFVKSENYVPFIPKNTGEWGEFGFSGIIRAAAIVFFAYVGFDAVSTAAQETKRPQRDMPIGILGSLAICAVLYILFSFVMIGVAHYTNFRGQEGIAPVAVAIQHMGSFGWLNYSIIPAILIGFSSVILVMLLGQSRVFYSMSRDGLIPKSFSDIHVKYRTPYKSNLLFMMVISIAALFMPTHVASELSSIGTLLAFIIVSTGVLIMRKTMPDVPRAFCTPWVPVIPVLGILTCLFMMVFLPFETWVRLILWILVGHDVYVFYGSKYSQLGVKDQKGYQTLSLIGLSISITLFVLTVFCYNQIGKGYMDIFWTISVFHIALYGLLFLKKRRLNKK